MEILEHLERGEDLGLKERQGRVASWRLTWEVMVASLFQQGQVAAWASRSHQDQVVAWGSPFHPQAETRVPASHSVTAPQYRQALARD